MAGPGGAEVGRISIRVVPNTDRFRAELKAQLDAIENSVRGKIHMDLELDSNGLREKVQALTAGLDKTAQVKLKPDIQIGDALAKWSALKAALAKDAKIKIDVEVDKNRIQRAFSGIGDKLSSLFSGSGGSVDLGSFGRTGAIVAAVAALAAPALALLSGALVSLPALLSAVAIPIAAVALGLDGLKKAAAVLTQPLADLKATMSQKFQDVFTPILTKLTGVFPTLEGSLPAVAQGLGDVARSFVDVLTSQSGLEKIKGTIGNIANAISASAPGIGKLTDGLLGLANGVTAKFPAVSGWINKVGDSFSAWVNKVTADGSLDRAMNNFGETLKGVLDIIGDLAKQGFDWLQDPKFGDAMKTFVADIKNLVSEVLPGLGTFFQDITNFLDGVNTAIDKLKGAPLPDWITGGTKGEPTVPGTGNSFLPPTLKNNPAQETADSFRATVAVIEGQLISLWAQIKAGFSQAWTETVTSFQASMSILGGIAQTAWATVVSVTQAALSGIGSFFTSIPGQLSSAWASLGGIASGAWQAVVAAVQQAMAGAVAAVVSGAAQVVAEVVALGGKVVSACANFGSLLIGAGAALIQGLINGIESLAGAAIAKAVGIATSVANAVRGALGIHSPSKVFTDIGAQTMQGLQDGIEGGFQGVVDRATALAKAITDAVNNGLTGVEGSALKDQLKQQISEIGLESDQLKVQLNGTDDKGQKTAIRDQRSQLQALRDQLNLQQDQLGFSQKYGDSVNENDKSNQTLGDSLTKIVDIGKGFAMANINQFESDLGISGNGAIPQLAEQGIGFLTSTLSKLASGALSGAGTSIHVNSVDEALAAKTNLDNKRALQYTQR